MNGHPPRLSVIIPTLRREAYLVDTIRQVLDDNFNDLELIVVDQSAGHNEPTTHYLESLKDPRFRYFVVQPVSGVAAKNFGLRQARADIVVFFDDDLLLDPGCLRAHYEAYRDHPDIGGVAGRVAQDGIPVTQTLLRFDKHALSGYLSFNYLHAEYTDTAPGGNMSVKRRKALAVGGFDTNFLRSQHREESEFSARYYRAGNKFYFEPKASVVHLLAPSGGTRIAQDFADNPDYYKNHLYFVLHYCKIWDLPVALCLNLRFYALRKNPRVTLYRIPLFIWGLVVAIKRSIAPHRIVSTAIKELP
jgi:glycosyltransferase involved in cell wall biosynthesis